MSNDPGTKTIVERVEGRTFPSVFQAWNTAEALNYGPGGPAKVPLSGVEDLLSTMARHDLLWFEFSRIGLKAQDPQGSILLNPQFTTDSLDIARRNRARLLAANPHAVILVSLHYMAAGVGYIPPDSPWWKMSASGRQHVGGPEYHAFRLDIANPDLQDAVAGLCAAFIKTGVFDGCFLDFWRDQNATAARVALIQKIRAAIPPQAIIVGNVNNFTPQATAQYLNGMFMEGFGDRIDPYFSDWRTAAANLGWGQSHLRPPAITALEGNWAVSRDDYALMRQVTTMSLVFSNGYVSFGDPNEIPTPDHLHDWYPFWDKSLGRPSGPLAHLERPDANGAYSRAYEKGVAVFNPPDNQPVTLHFSTNRKSAGTGQVATSFTINPGDGDLYLTSIL